MLLADGWVDGWEDGVGLQVPGSRLQSLFLFSQLFILTRRCQFLVLFQLWSVLCCMGEPRDQSGQPLLALCMENPGPRGEEGLVPL